MKADIIGAGIIKEVINDMDSGYAASAEFFFPPLQKIKWVFSGLAAALLIGYISAKLAVNYASVPPLPQYQLQLKMLWR